LLNLHHRFPACRDHSRGARPRKLHEAGIRLAAFRHIGGLFFRANHPKSLAERYRVHLGVAPIPTSYGQPSWHTEAGTTVFAPFSQTTEYFGDPHQLWMVNFRVRSLDRMAAQLRAAGIEVKLDPEHYPNGRFARIHDPEGNPIELWEPAAQDAANG
jgi:catechol 2,3-dioxygenase-like lactoylglutathione lyase family enzyme